jgi:thiol-disulfide isomerase/thioredoxin
MAHRDRFLARVSFGFLALAAGLTAHAQSAAAFPDTGPGRCASAWFEMMRGGGDASVAAFETAWASPKRLSRVPVADRTKSVERMRQDMPGIHAKEILLSEPDEITVFAGRGRGPDLTLEFGFDPQAPGKLEAIRISEGLRRPEPLTAGRRASTVEAAAACLESTYVFPEVAAKMAADVRARLAAGKYDAVRTEAALARTLTEDLRAVSNDLHLRVVVDPERAAAPPPPSRPADARSENYAFRRVEVLDGNVGYVRLDGFLGGPGAEKTAATALAFVSHADALIFDMRWNGGGHPAMVRYITSWLFATPTHLNDMVDRDGDVVEEFWTLEEIPGTRFAAEVPVYVLTSGNTFSGAEEFTYNLQALKRAAVVGERTGGGAHPTRMERLNERFAIGVPYLRARNPITRANWEGKGVEPDVAVAAEAALDRALAEARTVLAARRHAALRAETGPASRPFALLVGDPAPPLVVDRWLKGSPVTEFRKGHVYVIEFWATWCGPCKEGIPHLTGLQKKHGDKLTVVGLSVWEPRDRDVDPFVKAWDARMQYTVGVDKVVGADDADEEKRSRQAVEKGLMSKAYLVDSGARDGGIPQAFIVDGGGRIAWMGDPTEMDEPLERVLAGTFDLAAATAAHRAKMDLEAFARPLRTRARDARRTGNLEEALGHVEAILARGAITRDQVQRFKLLVQMGRQPEAVAYYESLKAKLKWHEATDMMSMVAYDARDLSPETARAAVAALSALGREHTWPLMTMAHLEHRLGRKSEALAAADRALAIAKDEEKKEMLEARKKYEAGGGSLREP